jgi:hypothetical protein
MLLLATVWPSALTATPRTPPVWPGKVTSGRPPSTAQSRTVPSKPPLATVRLSALIATPRTTPVWPSRTASEPRVSHTRTVPSRPPGANLVARYGGNGLALKLVGDTIRQVFAGDVAAFLEETHSCVFGGIRRLLDVQFKRLSSVERDILCWLAVQRESATFGELTAFADSRHGRGAVLESLEALRRRSLIERTDALGGFTLQPVVLDYVIAWMTEQVPARAAW